MSVYSIVSYLIVSKCERSSRRFQPGEGPSALDGPSISVIVSNRWIVCSSRDDDNDGGKFWLDDKCLFLTNNQSGSAPTDNNFCVPVSSSSLAAAAPCSLGN